MRREIPVTLAFYRVGRRSVHAAARRISPNQAPGRLEDRTCVGAVKTDTQTNQRGGPAIGARPNIHNPAKVLAA
jgi:hypothetical protein